MSQNGWIGFDLDGTLAEYNGWKGEDHIGEPHKVTLEAAQNLIKMGFEVKVFTARAERESSIPIIQAWCEKHGLGKLDVTNRKDFRCLYIVDDRAVQVNPETGMLTSMLIQPTQYLPRELFMAFLNTDYAPADLKPIRKG